MKFVIDAKGEAVEVEVTHYQAPCPMKVTGTGFGDAEPPEEEEFEYILRDQHGIVREDLDCRPVYDRALQHYKKLKGIR